MRASAGGTSYKMARCKKGEHKVPYTKQELDDIRTLDNEEFKRKHSSSVPYFIWYREKHKKDYLTSGHSTCAKK